MPCDSHEAPKREALAREPTRIGVLARRCSLLRCAWAGWLFPVSHPARRKGACAGNNPRVTHTEANMGKFTASVKGGLHANYSASLGSIQPYNASDNHRIAAQALDGRRNMEFRAIVDSLVASGVGGTAAATYGEIEPNVEMGGRRTILSTSIINRATTASDISDVRETLTSLSSDTHVPSPPANLDRNPLGTR